jgi:hypothetical protein
MNRGIERQTCELFHEIFRTAVQRIAAPIASSAALPYGVATSFEGLHHI